MKQTKVHKDGRIEHAVSPCGLPEYVLAKRSKDWSNVTCKNCLKRKGYATVKRQENLKEINEELNNLSWTTEDEDKNVPNEKTFKEMYEQVTQTGSNLTEKDILVPPNDDELLPWTAGKEDQLKTPYQKWEAWYFLACDYPIDPQVDDVWNGAIDTVCKYLRNEMCTELGLDETDEILERTKKKFKEK